MLVHGQRRARLFAPMIGALVAAGYGVTAFLNAGHGDPSHEDERMTCTHALLEVVDTHGPFWGVVGHSLGAGMAITAARLGVHFQRYVLISPVVDLVSNMDLFGRAVGLSAAAVERMRRLIWPAMRATVAHRRGLGRSPSTRGSGRRP